MGLVESGFTRVGLGFTFLTHYQLCCRAYLYELNYGTENHLKTQHKTAILEWVKTAQMTQNDTVPLRSRYSTNNVTVQGRHKYTHTHTHTHIGPGAKGKHNEHRSFLPLSS